MTTTQDRLDQTVSVLQRTTYAAFLALAIVLVVCLAGLMVGGTYGILHQGDDFDRFGGGGGGGGDIIVLPRLLG